MIREKLYRDILFVVALAIVVTLIFDFSFESFIMPRLKESANVRKVGRLIENQESAEVPIFGSSVAKHSYIPDSLGPNYYNYGMAGSVFIMIEPLMKIEFEKRKFTPILIDFEHHFFLSHPALRIEVANYIPNVNNDHLRRMIVEQGKYRGRYAVPGLRFFGQYNKYLIDFANPTVMGQIENKGGLFFRTNKGVKEKFFQRRLRLIQERVDLEKKSTDYPTLMTERDYSKLDLLNALLDFNPSEKYVSRFEKLLSENRHRDVILVYSPQTEIKLMGIRNIEDIYTFLEELKSRNENLYILDYSRSYFPLGSFRDGTHMNLEGARVFSSALKRDLETLAR